MFRTLTPTLAILAALLIFFLLIRPQYDELRAVQQETADYEKAVQDYEKFRAKIDAHESTRNRISVVERDRLDAFIPRELDTTQSLVDLEALAKRSSLLFGNVTVLEGAPADDRDDMDRTSTRGMSAVPEHADISFDVIGTYAQFKELLSGIERSLTIFEVTKISVIASEGPFLQFSVTVRTYALPSVTAS